MSTLIPTAAALVGRDLTVTLTNRAWVVLLQLGAVTPPIVSLLVWTGAVARGATPPVPVDQLVTWFVLVAVVSMVTSSWTASFLAEDIRTGGLSIWLVRPCPALLPLAANNAAEKAVKLVVLLPMVAVRQSSPSCSTCSSAASRSGSRTSTASRASWASPSGCSRGRWSR